MGALRVVAAALLLTGCWDWDRFAPIADGALDAATLDASSVDASALDADAPIADGALDAAAIDAGGVLDADRAADGSIDAGGDGGCGGCIDEAGVCVDGTTVAACGAGGVECVACTCAGDACVAGACVPSHPVIDLSANTHHVCVLLADRTLRCVGSNTAGQLGTTPFGAGEGSSAWIPPSGATWDTRAVADVEVGHDATFFVDEIEDGISLVGSRPGSGVLDANVQTLGPGRYEALAAGANHFCARRTDGSLLCSGLNTDGQLGDGTVDSRTALEVLAAPTDTSWTEVALGQTHSCGILRDGSASRLHCWGANSDAQLGLGEPPPPPARAGRLVPTPVDTTYTDWTSLAAGKDHTCATRGGEVHCWGDNSTAQCGQPVVTDVDFSTPQRVLMAGAAPLDGVTSISAGRFHTCALRGDGSLYCWGSDRCGQLGRGTMGGREPIAAPVVFARGARWVAHDHFTSGSCAVLTGGSLYCWGRNGAPLIDEVDECGDTPVTAPERVCL